MTIWIAEIWNTDTEEWEILDGVFHETKEEAALAISEECEVESGWPITEPWEPNPDNKNSLVNTADATESIGAEIPVRIRALEPAY